ncbi:hypothetical protein E2C01_050373 [Portunus trituberculatus]|uniref:Uncharacterized protein n=1 Tax=Portunus trituberculatus TaxID=210409 RepID=A0A5B7GBX1_PORTR|nr:hypothetical protein [Portunus trituberculatus]
MLQSQSKPHSLSVLFLPDRLAKFAAFLNVMRRLKLYRGPGEVLPLSELYNLLLLLRYRGEKLSATYE